tara:strand:- start:3018 stop:3302 length:285 start_codon:yes stop_codon:yes gene_type:complete
MNDHFSVPITKRDRRDLWVFLPDLSDSIFVALMPFSPLPPKTMAPIFPVFSSGFPARGTEDLRARFLAFFLTHPFEDDFGFIGFRSAIAIYVVD